MYLNGLFWLVVFPIDVFSLNIISIEHTKVFTQSLPEESLDYKDAYLFIKF